MKVSKRKSMKEVEAVKEKKTEPKFRSVVLDKEILPILKEFTNNLFSTGGKWANSCLKQPNGLKKENLPCHLRDEDWLAKFINQELIKNGLRLIYGKIVNFVKSPYFQKARKDFELEIVKCQIENTVANPKKCIFPEGGYDTCLLLDKKCDMFFRDSVKLTLQTIGMDGEVVEEGIEKYSNMWREKFMERAFENTYIPLNFTDTKVPELEKGHKENWMKYRRFRYYLDNQESVDKYGEIHPDMKMSREEYEELLQALYVQGKKREKTIKKWHKEFQSPVKNMNK